MSTDPYGDRSRPPEELPEPDTSDVETVWTDELPDDYVPDGVDLMVPLVIEAVDEEGVERDVQF